MVTMSKWGGANGTAEAEFCGLSTDNKPIDEGIPIGLQVMVAILKI